MTTTMNAILPADKVYVPLDGRGVLALSGADIRPFLQGLISNDIDKVAAERAIYAAFLTPQGKYLHDFFVAETAAGLLLDGEVARREDLLRRLKLYRLRSKVELADATDRYRVVALIGEAALAAVGLPAEPGAAKPFAGGAAFVDPRLAAAGARAILPREADTAAIDGLGFTAGDEADYDRLRLSLGLPDGSRDMVVEKATLLESGFDELNGVEWDKGCYMGQELTARTKYRGLVKKRLMPVTVDGTAPEAGTPILAGDKEAGEMRSSSDGQGLALMRLEALDKAARFTAGAARITPRKPDWAES